MVCRFFQNVDTVHGDAAGARDGSDEFGYEEESRGVDESTADDEKINWRGRIRENVLDLFQRTMFKTNILHCIYRFYNSDRMESDVHRRIQEIPSSFPHTNLFIIASHGDHLHVLHDCSWTGSTCRCACVKNFERLFGAYAYRAKRWVIRKFKWNAERAVNTLFYLAKGRRQIEHCQFGRFLVRPGDRPSHKSRYSALFDWLQNRQKDWWQANTFRSTITYSKNSELAAAVDRLQAAIMMHMERKQVGTNIKVESKALKRNIEDNESYGGFGRFQRRQ
uniref:Uncharacterized protein n=1 Tax=Cacopsylla melanoneura TaxID=428564 RepID=A0A8D8RGL3_9HEMI